MNPYLVLCNSFLKYKIASCWGESAGSCSESNSLLVRSKYPRILLSALLRITASFVLNLVSSPKKCMVINNPGMILTALHCNSSVWHLIINPSLSGNIVR